MNDLIGTLRTFARLFEDLEIPYAIMGGWAVRVYALPRPTYDVDFTITIDRARLPELYAAADRHDEMRFFERCAAAPSDGGRAKRTFRRESSNGAQHGVC